jgi:hypothetical protein
VVKSKYFSSPLSPLLLRGGKATTPSLKEKVGMRKITKKLLLNKNRFYIHLLLVFSCSLLVDMYLYSFNRFFGFDKVCLLDTSGKKKVKPGDLLIFGNQYFLALGDKIVFPEQYEHLNTVKADLIYKQFLTTSTLGLFHRMVESYYTTYKSVVRLFVANNIEKLLEREGKLKASKDKKFEI